MRVKLKVLKGGSAGKLVEVKVPQFIIGRSSGCQLRPQSDAISRQHCAILLSEEGATVRDLGSRNGTVVNGETISQETPLQTGDELRIGPFCLQVFVTDDEGAVIKKPVAPQRDVVTRIDSAKDETVSRKISDSDLISDWLSDPEDQPPSTADSTVTTRQFKLDDTERIELKKASEEVESRAAEKEKKNKKKEPGKLPQRKQDESTTSQEAAEKTLRKMFNRGL